MGRKGSESSASLTTLLQKLEVNPKVRLAFEEQGAVMFIARSTHPLASSIEEVCGEVVMKEDPGILTGLEESSGRMMIFTVVSSGGQC